MSNLTKIEKKKENTEQKTFSRSTTMRTREMKIRLLANLLGQKCTPAPGPQMRLGTFPRGGRFRWLRCTGGVALPSHPWPGQPPEQGAAQV